jgi:hypothetical protein
VAADLEKKTKLSSHTDRAAFNPVLEDLALKLVFPGVAVVYLLYR